MLPLQATAEQSAALEHAMGLDKPLMVQLGVFLSQLIRLDFGTSWWQQVPCVQVIMERIPSTWMLVGVALTISVLVALPVGIMAAYRPNSLLDRFLTTGSLIGIC